jgi:hypothetical protein
MKLGNFIYKYSLTTYFNNVRIVSNIFLVPIRKKEYYREVLVNMLYYKFPQSNKCLINFHYLSHGNISVPFSLSEIDIPSEPNFSK